MAAWIWASLSGLYLSSFTDVRAWVFNFFEEGFNLLLARYWMRFIHFIKQWKIRTLRNLLLTWLAQLIALWALLIDGKSKSEKLLSSLAWTDSFIIILTRETSNQIDCQGWTLMSNFSKLGPLNMAGHLSVLLLLVFTWLLGCGFSE